MTTSGSPASAPVSGPVPARVPSRVSARIAGIAESATLAVDAKAKAKKAAGEDVVGFGAGEPDFPTPPAVVAAAEAACSQPKYHRYTPAPGLPELREAVARKTARDSGLPGDGGPGADHQRRQAGRVRGLRDPARPGRRGAAARALLDHLPGGREARGGRPVDVVTTEDAGYLPTVEQLEAARTERTKVLLWCSPSNPTGAVAPRALVEAVGRWAVEHGVWVVADEIYEHLVYGDAEHVSMPVAVPELADTCVVVNGVAKTYAMTGWRVGWLIGPADVVKGASNLQSHATSNVSNVAQVAALQAVSGDLDAVAEMRAAFDRRRRTMVRMLNDTAGVTCPEPQGAFYAYPSVKGVLGKQLRGRRPQTSTELAELLLDEVGVAVVPGEAFGTPGYFRLSYALGDDDLVKGVTRIQELFAEATD